MCLKPTLYTFAKYLDISEHLVFFSGSRGRRFRGKCLGGIFSTLLTCIYIYAIKVDGEIMFSAHFAGSTYITNDKRGNIEVT